MRLRLIPYIPLVVEKAQHCDSKEVVLKSGKKMTFYEISHKAEINGQKKHVTVIITQVTVNEVSGKLHYYSVRYTRRAKQKSP